MFFTAFSSTVADEVTVLCDGALVERMMMGTFVVDDINTPYAGLGCYFTLNDTIYVERIFHKMRAQHIPPSVYIYGDETAYVSILFRLRLSGVHEAIEMFGVDPAARRDVRTNTYDVVLFAESEFARARVDTFFQAYDRTHQIAVLLQSPLGLPERTHAHLIATQYFSSPPTMFPNRNN
jgi:hypothetical protein